VEEEVDKFYARIRHPYLTDIEIAWNGVTIDDPYPARIPDLFEGRPLTLRGRYEKGGRGELRIRGKIAGRTWERRIPVDLPDEESGNPAIGSLWARSRIADLERSMRHGENPETVEAITQLGLSHRLVTQYTSFVAVEEKLVVSDGHPRTVRVPVDLPQGVSWEGVFGGEGEQPVAPASGKGMAMMRKSGAPDQFKALGYVGSSGPALACDEAIGVPTSPGPGRPREEGASRELRSRQDVGSETWGSTRTIFPEPTAAQPGLAIGMTLASDTVAPDGTITLRITFTNRGATPVDVPAKDALRPEDLGLTVVGAAWGEMRFDDDGRRRSVRTEKLAPGATTVREVKVSVASLGRLTAGGAVHILLDGSRWGSADKPRVTARIAGR
jgi:hypothetical protein